MCTQRPCRCSCDMRRVFDIDDVLEGPPGSFHFGRVRAGEVTYLQLWVKLPCEGGELHGIPVRLRGQPKVTLDRPQWEWNGHPIRPTITPSLITHRDDHQEVWHGWFTNGRVVSC